MPLNFINDKRNKKNAVTREKMARAYQTLPTLADHLPWRDYNELHRCFLLEDNKSLGVCFTITPIPCEARPDKMLEEISKSISEALKNTIPFEKENPWILQVYVSKEAELNSFFKDVEEYFYEKQSKQSKQKNISFTEAYLKTLREHLEYVTRPGGIFQDTQVTNISFRGGLMHVYAVLYRRVRVKQSKKIEKNIQLHDIARIARKFSAQLRACGMKVKRMDGKHFFEWMAQWFNPKHKNGFFYPDETQKLASYDFAEQLFYHTPESFTDGWFFDGLPHKVLTIQQMTTHPAIGHLSAERKRAVDDKVFNLIDHLPEGSVFVMTVVLQAPSDVALHLKTISDSAVGHHALASKVKQEVLVAEKSIANGDALFPVVMAVYLKAETLHDLKDKEASAEVLLNSNGFKVITDNELFPTDAYLRFLPMCYDFYFDQNNTVRSRYLLLSDIAKLLPFYGRSRGTGHPGMVFFNRGGEPWTYDAMVDKSKNAHKLVLGETGTGKSNLLNFLIAHDLALYQSRFFIIDAGGSFDLLGDYCASLGLKVNKIKIDPQNPVSLNPFSAGLRIVDQLEALDNTRRESFLNTACEKLIQEQQANHQTHDQISPPIEDDEPRDILGEMVLAALMMITGGEKKEEESIRRSDRMLIMDAIIQAAYAVRAQHRDQLIASDIIDSFEKIALTLDPLRDAVKIQRAREMADAMRYFTQDPLSSRFFNTMGNPWIDADVTIIDFGLFAREGYEAHRSIAFAGCMNHILTLAEANQKSHRAIKVVCDENHLFTSIPLLADIETRVAKMGRKLGLWLWLATQNMKDFADGARRMLSQIELWLCLALPPDEVDQIERFKILTPEQRALLLSAQKEKGKYTEMVVLSAKEKGLCRNIPPTLYLAMAATDQDEKYHRARLMKDQQCSEIEAVKTIAKNMMLKKLETDTDD